MSENGKLTLRQILREETILEHAISISPQMAKRSVPISLFRKLLAAARWAIANGYQANFNGK